MHRYGQPQTEPCLTSPCLFYMLAASGGKGTSSPLVPLASCVMAGNFQQVPLGLTGSSFPSGAAPTAAHSSPLPRVPPTCPRKAQPFGCLQADCLSIAVANNADFLSTTIYHSPALTGWSTHLDPARTLLPSIRGCRPGSMAVPGRKTQSLLTLRGSSKDSRYVHVLMFYIKPWCAEHYSKETKGSVFYCTRVYRKGNIKRGFHPLWSLEGVWILSEVVSVKR